MNRFLVFFTISFTLLAAGCTSTGKSNHFLMSPVSPSSSPDTGKLVIGVGPVSIPDYLERPNVVSRVSKNRVLIPPDQKWASPLDAHLNELLAENLRSRLGLASAPVFPWPLGTRVRYQTMVDITNFIHFDGNVMLDAEWRILDRPSRVVKKGKSAIRIASDADYENMVAAMGIAVGRLADDIAAAVNALRKRQR